MNRGEFKNLPRTSDVDKWKEGELQIDEHIMKNNNIVPDWVENGKLIRTEVQAIRADLESLMRQSLGTPHEAQTATLEQRISEVNKKISAYNLGASSLVLQMMPLRLSWEIERAQKKLGDAGKK
eukprot:TRINITY_DN5268_c0_g1_i1.p1 TRINITY_DN5268_c0_g1~~TRINITY_DN5268_c0_g1_i1.p1  ORF type:complete len:124 (+),score=28.81 TRINITY_DN5268_c0_g1_i1:452-823(+)